MAGGYLGKISAVVAANTGDYVRKLNDSASTTKNFAKTISSDLSRASREASKSIEGILTPLQRVERALQNAASQKLAFRGFDGAIQTVEQLRKVIEKIADRPIELEFLLKESGLKTLEQIRQTIGSISEKNLTLALSVGGLEGLRRLRSDVQEVNGKLINVNVQTDATELDRLIEVFSQISPETIKKLKVDVEARQFDEAVLLTKQLVSVATQITDSYGRAKQQFAGFAFEVQSALGSGLKEADEGILKLKETIDNNIPIAAEEFNRLAKAAQSAEQALARAGEADAKVKALSGGAGLAVSRRGDVSRELDRAQASQQSGAGLNNAADLFARQKTAAEAVAVELAKMEAAELRLGDGARVTTKEFDRQFAILKNVTSQIERSAAAQGNADRVAAVITGNPQNFDQGRALQGQLESQIAGLNRSQRQDFKGLLTQANDLSVGADPANLEKYLDVLQKIQFEVAKKLRINVTTAEAEDNAKRLKASLASLRSDIKFRITGNFQSIDQAKAATESLVGRLGELGAQQAKELRPQFGKVIGALRGGDLSVVQKEFNVLKEQFDAGLDLKLRSDEATTNFNRLKASLLEIRDLAALKITGQFQNIDQAKAAVDGVVNSLGKLGAQQASGLAPKISAALKAIAASAASPNDSALRQTAIKSAAELQAVFDREYEIKVNADGATDEFVKLRNKRQELEKDLQRTFTDASPRTQARFADRVSAVSATLNNPSATKDQIDAAASSAAKLKTEIAGVERQASRLGGSFADFRAERDIRGAAAGLEFLRTQLLRATGDSSNAVAAVDRLAEAFQDAASTPGGFQKNAADLERLTNEAIQATAAVEGVSRGQGGLLRGFQRAGDVARGSFGNVGLAVQQAAFAFDDFFSVTGGLDQRIRAAGNNISQLGFILGGAWGLGVGIAVSVGAQFAAMLIKWANNGRTAEDQLRALNEVLDKQKSLASEISDSFASLADSIAGRGFSEAAGRAREFTKALEEIIKKQTELRQNRLIELDPAVSANRDRQQVIQRQLQQEAVDPERRIRLQLELQALRREEAAVRRRAVDVARQGPDFAIGRDAIARGFEVQRIAAQTRDANARRVAVTAVRSTPTSQAALDRSDFFTREIQLAGTDQQRIELARRRQAELSAAARENPAGADLANNAIVAIERVIRVLEDRIASNGVLRDFLTSINDAANSIQSAQGQVSEAIRAGIPAATLLQGTLDSLQQQIDNAQAAIRDANNDFASGLIAASDRNALVRDQQAVVDNASAARQRAVAEAAQLTEQRIVDPQVLFDARRQRAEANLQAAGLENGAIARQIRQLEAQREAIRNRIAQAPEAQREAVRQQAAADEAALNQQLAALESSTVALRRFTEELDRASQEAQSNLQSAQQRADEVRRASLAPGQGLAVPTVEDIDRANRNLREQRNAEQRVQDEVSQARIRAEQRAQDQADPLAATFRRLREIEEAARGGTLTTDMVAERRRLNQQVDAAVSQDPRVVAARDNSTRIEERQRAEQRGRDLAMTDAERAAREAARQAADITEAFSKDGLNGRFIANRVDQQAAINRLAENQMKQVAPLIAGFREERMNAILQGPSRAALNVADAQTTEGARELNRLLRGDDPAKDVNLVELQKQTETLERVIKAIEENGQGAIVDIRG